MQPKITNRPSDKLADKPELVTSGDLARKMNRSSYGIKRAIQRLGIEPKIMLSGISYYDPEIEKDLSKDMRGPNLKTFNR